MQLYCLFNDDHMSWRIFHSSTIGEGYALRPANFLRKRSSCWDGLYSAGKGRFLQALDWTEERFVDWVCSARLDVQDPRWAIWTGFDLRRGPPVDRASTLSDRWNVFFMMYGIETGLASSIDMTHKSSWDRICFRPLSFATVLMIALSVFILCL